MFCFSFSELREFLGICSDQHYKGNQCEYLSAIRMPKAMAMFERMMISSSMANMLSYTWLKRFDASEIHRLVQTLQEMIMIGWFNRNDYRECGEFSTSHSTIPANYVSIHKCI